MSLEALGNSQVSFHILVGFIFRDFIRNVNYDLHTAQGAAVAAGLLAAPPGGAAAAASAVAGAGAAAAAAAPDLGWLEAEEAARQRSLARLAPLLNADGGIADPDKAGRVYDSQLWRILDKEGPLMT